MGKSRASAARSSSFGSRSRSPGWCDPEDTCSKPSRPSDGGTRRLAHRRAGCAHRGRRATRRRPSRRRREDRQLADPARQLRDRGQHRSRGNSPRRGASRRGRGDLALGNIAGTIVHFAAFNAGVIALIKPLPLDAATRHLTTPPHRARRDARPVRHPPHTRQAQPRRESALPRALRRRHRRELIRRSPHLVPPRLSLSAAPCERRTQRQGAPSGGSRNCFEDRQTGPVPSNKARGLESHPGRVCSGVPGRRVGDFLPTPGQRSSVAVFPPHRPHRAAAGLA